MPNAPAPPGTAPAASARRGTLAFLTAFMATSHVDRHIVAVALPAIGAEMALNDLQLGVLSGIAFSVVFALAVVPLSLLSAFLDRRHVMAMAVFAWSAMTVLSGFAAGFAQLLLARIGIGIAEAAGIPASHTVVGEAATDRGRTRAFAVFTAGGNLGLAVALVGGGILTQQYGWRTAMIVAGLPGLALAALTYACIPRAAPDAGRAEAWLPMLRVAAGTISGTRAKRRVFVACALTSVINFGMVAWLPSFLVRVHDMPVQQVGLFVACTVGIGGAAGTVAVGYGAARLARRDGAWLVWLPALLMALGKPLLVAAFLVEDTRLSLALLTLPTVVGGAHLATTLSMLHTRLGERNRGAVSSFLLMVVNLTGYTLGPLVVGAVAWGLAARGMGDERLGYALIALQALSLPGLVAYYYAGRAARPASA